MKLTYAYPALVAAVPRNLRARRNVIVVSQGVVDVPEIDSEHAPVACSFTWDNGDIVYRYIDGEFYLPAGNVREGGKMPARAETSIAFRLVCEMAAGSKRPYARAWPDAADGMLYESHFDAGRSLFCERPYPDSRMPDDMFLRGTADLGTVNEEDVDFWKERAAEFTAQVAVVDGRVWTRVPEPLIEVRSEANIGLANIDVYGQHLNRLVHPPAPFGNGNGSIGKYWHTAVRFYPVTEFASLRQTALAATQSTPLRALDTLSVAMPEVFGDGFARLELERQARLTVANARTVLFRRYNWEPGVPVAMRNAYGELKAAADPRAEAPVDGDVLSELLETFLNEWSFLVRRTLSGQPIDFAQAIHAMEPGFQSVDRWRERPIEIGLGQAPEKGGMKP